MNLFDLNNWIKENKLKVGNVELEWMTSYRWDKIKTRKKIEW